MAGDSGGGTPPRTPPCSRDGPTSLSDLHGFHTVEATETFREMERLRGHPVPLAEPGEDARANHELAESSDPLAERRRARGGYRSSSRTSASHGGLTSRTITEIVR